jgi:hypothetical protein
MISIWFFVGCLLTAYGFLIFFAGVRSYAMPPTSTESMQQLHLPIWWGIGLTILGITYLVRFRPKG